GAIGSVGITGLPGPMPRSITLGQLEVRELSGLTALADPALLDRVPQFAPEEMTDGTLWIHRALQSHPAGAEPDRWLNTCALAALQRGPQKEFGLTLLRRMLESAESLEGKPDQTIAALCDAMLLMDLWDERQALPYAEQLQKIGLRQLEQGERRPSRSLR